MTNGRSSLPDGFPILRHDRTASQIHRRVLRSWFGRMAVIPTVQTVTGPDGKTRTRPCWFLHGEKGCKC